MIAPLLRHPIDWDRIITPEARAYAMDKGLVEAAAIYAALGSGPCEACGTTLQDRVVDHCHACGKVRGMLCLSCNALEGHGHDPFWKTWRQRCCGGPSGCVRGLGCVRLLAHAGACTTSEAVARKWDSEA